MILKKPYAFLIKYFRLIHFTLLIPLIYLIIRTTKIVTFFNDYANNGTFTYTNDLAGSHINVLMYLAIIYILVIGIIITYLFIVKKKSIKLYVGIISYYILLLVLLTIGHDVLGNISETVLELSTVRIYRDVAIIGYVPQLFFVIYVLIRALGFDIKKFNFSHDLKELEITASDNEEFEVNFDRDNYKQKRKIKRGLREFKYYVIENRFILSCIGVIVVVFSGILIYYNYSLYHKTYKEQAIVSNNGFQLQVNNSILTNLNYRGETIIKDKYYLAVSININNMLSNRTKIYKKDLSLEIDDKLYYPIYDRGDIFLDLGIAYKGEEIRSKKNDTYVLVYEVPKNVIDKDFALIISSELKVEKNNLSVKYKIIKVKPKLITNTVKVNEVNLNKDLNISNEMIEKIKYKVSNYSIDNSYTYTNNEVKKTVSINTARYGFNNTLIILKDEFKVSGDNYYADIFNKNMLFTNHAIIQYELNNKTYESKVINLTPTDLLDATVIQVDNDVRDAKRIKLILTFRDRKYYINLK